MANFTFSPCQGGEFSPAFPTTANAYVASFDDVTANLTSTILQESSIESECLIFLTTTDEKGGFYRIASDYSLTSLTDSSKSYFVGANPDLNTSLTSSTTLVDIAIDTTLELFGDNITVDSSTQFTIKAGFRYLIEAEFNAYSQTTNAEASIGIYESTETTIANYQGVNATYGTGNNMYQSGTARAVISPTSDTTLSLKAVRVGTTNITLTAPNISIVQL